MSCRVFLVGEGTCDIGDLANHAAYRRGREGFLQPLIRSLVKKAQHDLEIDFDGQKVMYLPKEPAGRIKAEDRAAENARRALALASQRGADALVVSFDVDKTPGRKASVVERRRKLREARASAAAGLKITRDGDPDAARLPVAVAIPCRMIEAWALADREALATLVGADVSDLDYPQPEDLWGDEAVKKTNHPKNVWERVTGGAVGFDDIGAIVQPAVLRRECPDSFVPFADEVEQAVEACPHPVAAPVAGVGSSRRRQR